MRKLSVKDIAKNGVNCYSLVIGISKRARQISEKADEEGEPLEEKPVQMAIRDFIADRVEIVPPNPELMAEDEDDSPAADYDDGEPAASAGGEASPAAQEEATESAPEGAEKPAGDGDGPAA